jgi:putative flippase GtrA
MRRLPPLLALIAATLLMMAVAFADGRPTVFYDSHAYDVMGRNLIETVEQYPASIAFKTKAGVKWDALPVSSDVLTDPATMGARSPYYGALLHGTWKIGSLWLLAALQSFLAAWVVYLLWRTLAPKAPSWSYLAVVAATVVGTSVSFFTTFAMPDVFAGIGGAAMVLILSQADRLKRREMVGLWLLSAFSMVIHKSHLGAGLVVAVAGAGLMGLMGLPLANAWRRMVLVLLAAMTAWFAGAAADKAYELRTGYKLGHPPFMMARMLADGPGKAYMRHACAPTAPGADEPYLLCQFQANVNTATSVKASVEIISNLILWSDRKTLGVFNKASFVQRITLEKQELAFAIGTVKFDPLGQAAASLKNWGQQLVAYQVDDPLRNPSAYLRGRYWPTTFIPQMIPNFAACRPPGDCRPPFDYEFLADWHGAVLALSLLLLAWRLTRRDVRQAVWRRGLKSADNDPARVAGAVLLLLGVVLTNAAVCGILSGPFARYQSRLIWLIPVGAGLVMCALPMRLQSLADGARGLWNWILAQWERLRSRPVIGRVLPPLDGHFARFCVVGGLGFAVDFTVLKVVVHLGMSPIGGRVVSFCVAVMATWLVNRAWTFRHHAGEQSLLKELASYLAVQSVGFAANFAVYTGMVVGVAALQGRLLPPMVAGTAAGLVINYLGAKHIVFRRRARAS